jgi:hypothetical protein
MTMPQSAFDMYLINGNITIFCGTHTENYKNDILNSSLLGELVTTSKHPRQPDLLWSSYVKTVNQIGWITKSREFQRFEFSSKSLLNIANLGLGSYLTKEEKQTLLNAFLHLKKPPTQSTVQKAILDKLQTNTFVAENETTSLPIATSTRLTVVLGNATVITLQIAFKATNELTIDMLVQPILDSIKDGKSNTWLLVSSLDAREYDKFRATVIKKIGTHINSDLLHVPHPVWDDGNHLNA